MSRLLLSPTMLAAFILAGAGPAAAVAPMVGTWNLQYGAGTRIENGTPTVISGTGKLIVQLQGDSLIARLIPDPIDRAPPRPESRMASPAGAGPRVVLI